MIRKIQNSGFVKSLEADLQLSEYFMSMKKA